jgi:hypothetical protein
MKPNLPSKEVLSDVLAVQQPGREIIKLKRWHLAVVAHHLRGMKHGEIERVMALKPGSVGRILRSKPARDLIAAHYAMTDAKIKGLMDKAIDALNDSLTDEDPKVKLIAANMIFRATGQYKDSDGANEETAEDVLKRIIVAVQNNTQNNTNINMRDER